MAKGDFIPSVFLVLLFMGLLVSQSCLKSKRPGIPPEVVEVLNLSGIHKPQLNRFILECMQSCDSLKMNAGFFLVSNLHRNYTAYYKLVDSIGNSYELEPEDFKNLWDIRVYIDSLENNYGELSYKADSFAIDYSRIRSDILLNNIHQAFNSWENNKLGLQYDFETFKKYILPFKVGNENIETFRDFLFNEFDGFLDTNKTFTENVNHLNNHINSLVIYDERYIKHLPVQPIKELLENGKGNLADINILKVKIFRSLGIAAVMDYTPFIADSSGWYVWTTIFSPDGNEIHLDISNGILETLIDNRIAKVYRRTYFEDTTSLFAHKDIKESTPRFLGHFNYFDVTSSYFETEDFTISHSNTDDKYLYLAVYNDGKWRAVDWALNKDGYVHYFNLGKGVLYLPIEWDTINTKSYGKPFVIIEDKITEYSVEEELQDISLRFTSPNEEINPQKKYDLLYWDDEWKIVKSKLSHDGLIIAKVPKKSVFLLWDNDRFYDERIFVMDQGKQMFF